MPVPLLWVSFGIWSLLGPKVAWAQLPGFGESFTGDVRNPVSFSVYAWRCRAFFEFSPASACWLALSAPGRICGKWARPSLASHQLITGTMVRLFSTCSVSINSHCLESSALLQQASHQAKSLRLAEVKDHAVHAGVLTALCLDSCK